MIQRMNNCKNRGGLLKKEEIERDREGREGGQISRGALWPCIVMDREFNFDRSLSDRLVGPCD